MSNHLTSTPIDNSQSRPVDASTMLNGNGAWLQARLQYKPSNAVVNRAKGMNPVQFFAANKNSNQGEVLPLLGTL